RAEETTVPSFPLELTITPIPFATVTPEIPAMKAPFWVPTVPIRILLDSAATPGAPISMLLFPVVRLLPALLPRAILFAPVVLLKSAKRPVAVLSLPVVLPTSAPLPSAVFWAPVVLRDNADAPVEALAKPVLFAASA